MTNPFTSFTFAATGASTNRTMPNRLVEVHNVRDFGAVGDGFTDDLDAIMATVNWNVVTLQTTVSNLVASFTGVVAYATFTGSISSNTLSVSGVTGTVSIGQTVSGAGVASNTIITAGSGSSWTVSGAPQTVTSEAMTTNCILTASSVTGSIAVNDTLLNNGGTSNTITNGTLIASQQSGSAGVAGVYILTTPQNFTSQSMITVTTTLTFASVPSKPFWNAMVTDLDNASFGNCMFGGKLAYPTLVETNLTTTIKVAFAGGLVSAGDRIKIEPYPRGIVYFPPGTYYVRDSIDFGAPSDSNMQPFISFSGEMGLSVITGNFNDYILRRTLASTPRSGPHGIEKLTIINQYAGGGGIRLGVSQGAYIRDCDITADVAINDDNTSSFIDGGNLNGSFEVIIENCNCRPYNALATGTVGCNKTSNGPVSNCTFTGFDVGMQTSSGEGCAAVQGCRFEGNNVGFSPSTAIEAGWGSGAGSNFLTSGCYFKNNGIGIDKGGGGANYLGLKIEAATGAIAGNPQYGIKIASNSLGGSKMHGISVIGQYQQKGIYLEGGESVRKHSAFMGVSSVNSGPGANWGLPTTAKTAIYKYCNVASVFTVAGLPAITASITAISWSGGTITVTFSTSIDVSPLNSKTAYLTISGVANSGYNGTFVGTVSDGSHIQFSHSDPGASGSVSGATIFFTGGDFSTTNAFEGDVYNVSDANTGTWGAAVTGAGSNHVKVRFTPTAWTVVGA